MKNNITELCETGIFAAVIFIAIFTLKIPTPFTEGYTHLGDCMIFTAVVLLGVKRGAIAGGIGAGLADLIGGFGVWVLPTVIFKSLMAVCMGTIIQRQIIKGHPRMLFLLGAVTGGIVQSVGYVLVRAFLYGTPAAIASAPILALQTGIGILLAFMVIEALKKTALRGRMLYVKPNEEI